MNLHTVNRPDKSGCQIRIRLTVCDHTSVLDYQNAVGVKECMFGVMSRENNEIPRIGKFSYLSHDANLIAVIQICGRLIHNENLCVLNKSAGDQRKLAFSSRNLRIPRIFQFFYTQTFHGFQRLFDMLRFGFTEQTNLICHAHENKVKNGKIKDGIRRLRNVCHHSCDTAAVEFPQINAVQMNLPGIIRQESQYASEESAFADAVGTQNCQQIAGFRTERYAV